MNTPTDEELNARLVEVLGFEPRPKYAAAVREFLREGCVFVVKPHASGERISYVRPAGKKQNRRGAEAQRGKP